MTPQPIPDEVLRRIAREAQLPLVSHPGFVTEMHLSIGGEPLGCSVNDLASELLACREALRFYGRANVWERKMRRAQVGEMASWFNERHQPWVIVLSEWEEDGGRRARALLPEEAK